MMGGAREVLVDLGGNIEASFIKGNGIKSNNKVESLALYQGTNLT